MEIAENCENLVCEQKLQQKGWAAVVANLESIARYFSTAENILLNKISMIFISLFNLISFFAKVSLEQDQAVFIKSTLSFLIQGRDT